MNLREAAQQALVCVVCVRDMAVHPDSVQMFENTITALRTALAEPQEKYTWGTPLLDAFLLAPKPGQLKDRGQE
jgi:hypothetical protein